MLTDTLARIVVATEPGEFCSFHILLKIILYFEMFKPSTQQFDYSQSGKCHHLEE